MKKLLSLTALAALITLAILSGCKKEDPSFNGDFTHLSTELLESAIGVDSALVIDKIIKDGFVINEEMLPTIEYTNNSYNLCYSFDYKDKKVTKADGYTAYYSKEDPKYKEELKSLFTQENNKLVSRNMPLFKGTAYETFEKRQDELCEKNPTDFKQIIGKTDYEKYDANYANNDKAYNIVFNYFTSGPKIKDIVISVEKTSSESYIYKQASGYCEN